MQKVRRFLRSKLLRIAVFTIIGVICLVYLSVAIYIGSQVHRDDKTRSEVILVLGARGYINGTYNPCLAARVDHAVALYKEKYAPKLLVSGGMDKEDGVNEAETMKKIAMEKGIPAADILMEKQSTSTYENFLLSRRILEDAHLKTVIIVTEPFHTPRASLIAQKLGYTYTFSPATDSPCWQRGQFVSRYFLKEPLAVITYKLQQKL